MNETMRREQPAPATRTESFLLLRMPPTVTVVRLKESLNELQETAGDPSLLFWMLGLLFFGLGDTVSSFLVFSVGGTELNPVLRLALALPGGLLAFVLFKTLALLVLWAIAYMWEGFHRWMIPVLMTMAGVYLTTSNMMAYLKVS